MPITNIDIEDIADVGVIHDVDEHLLPPEAWGFGDNMRIQDGVMKRLPGHSQVFGTPLDQPMFLLYVASSAQPWWLYASSNKIMVWDGSVHTDISRTKANPSPPPATILDPYSVVTAAQWNGTIHGGLPILNNGNDIPQVWLSYADTTKMINLANWPNGQTAVTPGGGGGTNPNNLPVMKARVIRSFGAFLVALNCTLDGVNKPHMVWWSTEADPGVVPASWDISDPTQEAGNRDLPDLDSGIILDGMPLEGTFYIYKENAVWRMRTIGGTFVFDFSTQLLETIGLLATRCVTLTPDGKHHIFATQDDIAMHDGTNVTSLLSKKMRRYLFNQIDISNYQNCFIFSNPLYREVWFCYPQSGSTFPDRAIILNMDGGLTESDVSFQCAEQGIMETANSLLWSTAPASWDGTLQPWSSSNRRRVLLGAPVQNKIYLLDSGTTRDGASYIGTLRRQGLSLVGRDRRGNWMVDFQKKKVVSRLWPKVTGGTVNVRVGSQEKVNGPVTWSSSFLFDPTTQDTVDLLDANSSTSGAIEGRAIAVEFSASNDFTLEGYKVDLQIAGNF